jgi:uncharacterized DUF497 family protein
MEFEWDDANRAHIALHDVTPEDCEAAFASQLGTRPGNEMEEEPRWKTTGIVNNRRLEAVWTIRNGRRRVVTAYWRSWKRK